jgi:hypothetical protein
MRRLAFVLGLAFALACAAPVWAHEACPNGASTPLVAGNATGEMLVSWQEARQGLEEVCSSSLQLAAVGSTASGFTDVGPVSAAGKLSSATGAFLDGAGDGWLVGVHELYAGSSKYGPQYKESGAWLAFRPAGGIFRAPVELPTANSASYPLVAGDQAGATIVAWNTKQGAHLAWGGPSGELSIPRFIGHEFRVSAVGVDEAGTALIAGYYADGRGLASARSVALVTGADGSFSAPRILARRPWSQRRHLQGVLGAPAMGVGPSGQAVLDWTVTPNPLRGGTYDTIVYRQAEGRIDRPVRFEKFLLGSTSDASQPDSGATTEPNTITVDAAGRATIASRTLRGLVAVRVASNGHVSAVQRITSQEGSQPSLAGNAAGQTALAWTAPSGTPEAHTTYFALGTTALGFSTPQAVTHPTGADDLASLVTIGAHGEAAATWIQDEGVQGQIIQAVALTPGAVPVQVARIQPAP